MINNKKKMPCKKYLVKNIQSFSTNSTGNVVMEYSGIHDQIGPPPTKKLKSSENIGIYMNQVGNQYGGTIDMGKNVSNTIGNIRDVTVLVRNSKGNSMSLESVTSLGGLTTEGYTFKCESIKIDDGNVFLDGKPVKFDIFSLGNTKWEDFLFLIKEAKSDQDFLTGKDEKLSEDENLDSNTCKICMENKIKCVIIPCGHTATCIECSNTLKKKDSLCPICRGKIDSIYKTFNS